MCTDSMAINIVLLVLGVIIVLKGADWLTDGAVNIATRFGVSQMVIGLTIVAMGTSMPEFCVSMVSALKGTPDLAVGNVVGSNTLNTLLIVGCSALVAPIMVKRSSVKRDIPFAVVASLLMLLFCLDGAIGRVDAAVLFAGFCLFMFVTLKYAKQQRDLQHPLRQMAQQQQQLFLKHLRLRPHRLKHLHLRPQLQKHLHLKPQLRNHHKRQEHQCLKRS